MILHRSLSLFLVTTASGNHRHHGLHANGSSHVLTAHPGVGDVVDGRIEVSYAVEAGEIFPKAGTFRIDRYDSDRGAFARVTQNPGRSAGLGDDSLDEEAWEGDPLPELVREIFRGVGWRYAPIDVEWIQLEACSDEELARLGETRHAVSEETR